jgi:hypothetical protein
VASQIPEFQEFTAAAAPDASYLTLTANTPGYPFKVTTSTLAVGSVTVTETTPGKFAVNEVHKISLVGTYTGGTFTLTYNVGAGNVTTGNIAWNATAAAVQTALQALTGVGAGQVLVTGGPGPNSPWFVQWTGTLGGQVIATGTVNGTNLTGNGSVAVTETTRGNGSSDDVQFLDCTPMSFQFPINFTLTLDGQTTSTLNSESTPAAIQSALQALPNVGSGNCSVLGPALQNSEPTTYVIHFTGALGGQHVSTLVVGGYVSPQPGASSAPVVTKIQNGGQTTSDDIQWIDLGFTATGAGTNGTVCNYTLTVGGQTTGALSNLANGGSNAGTIAAALGALSTVGSNNAVIYMPSNTIMTGQVVNGILVRFTGGKANTNMPSITVGVSAGPGATVTRQSYGGANVNEVQQIVVYGTGGTFTLTAAAQTTSAIAFGAAAATVQTRIQTDLSATFSAVTVSGSGTLASPYVVTVTNPANTATAVMTGNGSSLTGGGGTIAEQTAGAAGVNEVQTVTLIAGVTGGTFKLSFGGAQTIATAFNASAATVQTNLRALATINTVNVAGSNGGPYIVTFSGAQGNAPQALITGDGTGLTGQSGSQTLIGQTATFSSGPNHYNDPLNWTRGRVPDSLDDVSFESGTSDCLHGLNQMATFTVNTGTDVVTFTSLSNLINDQIVRVTSTTTLPAPLAAGTSYYLINVDRDAQTCQLALTSGGAAIDITTAGTGTHTIGVRLNSIEFNSDWSGKGALPLHNENGEYYEYRPLYLHVGLDSAGAQTVTVGTGQGGGSGRIHLDTDVDKTLLKIIDTGGSSDAGAPAFLWKGTHAQNTLNQLNGDVGVACLYSGELASLASIQLRAGTLELGGGITLTGPIDQTGGKLLSDAASINGVCLLR